MSRLRRARCGEENFAATIFDDGGQSRDFTYVDNVVDKTGSRGPGDVITKVGEQKVESADALVAGVNGAAQVALLLAAMERTNFAVASAYSKTEVLQVAVFGIVLVGLVQPVRVRRSPGCPGLG